MLIKVFLLCYLFLFIFVGGIIVELPEDIAGVYPSAYITFGEKRRLDFTQPRSGNVQKVSPLEGCVAELALPAFLASIAITTENEMKEKCNGKTERFFQYLESQNFTSVIVSFFTLYVPGKALGHPRGTDLESFSIPVTYISDVELSIFSPYLNSNSLYVTLNNDRGAFYDLSVNPGFKFYQYSMSTMYLIAGLAAIYLFAIETKESGITYSNYLGVTICNAFCCIVRGIKIAWEEHEDYYMDVSRPISRDYLSPIMFWFPLVVGTTAYTLTAFAWIRTITSLEVSPIVEKMEKPLKFFFISLIPISIILPAATFKMLNVSMPIMSIFIVMIGSFESIVFGYYGFKLLNYMSKSTAILKKNRKTLLEKKITIFVLLTVAFWLCLITVAVGFFVYGVSSHSNPTGFFILAIGRDVFTLALEVLILVILRKRDSPTTSSRKESDPNPPISLSIN